MPIGPRARHVVFADAFPWRRRSDLASTPAPRAEPRPAFFCPEDSAFVRWLFEQAGLEMAHYRLETIQRRLLPCLRVLRVDSSTEARCMLQSQPTLVSVAMSTLLIGVTSFFRDPSVFATLRDPVLPSLLAGRPAPRIWSVGCSDGVELLSVAILLSEMDALDDAYLLGTDCRPDAIRRARAGEFEVSLLKPLPAALRSRHFAFRDGRWQVAPALADAAHWRTGNVMTLPEPGSWDMILCRNVAMYMQSAAGAALWRTLERCLGPGGILVVGKAERPTEARGLAMIAPCIYRREAV